MSAQPKKTRAEINRENALKSTGPKTAEGKAASSRNAFKHGIYSNEIVIPGENADRYEELLADLRAEHQPATPTEEILVDELAQHFWHIRRWRKMETQMYIAQGPGTPDSQPLDMNHLLGYVNSGLFNVLHRSLASAERNFHRVLSSLMRLKKQNGFVPSEPRAQANRTATQSACDGFVPLESCAQANGTAAQLASAGFVPQKHLEAVSRVASLNEILPEFPSPISTKAA